VTPFWVALQFLTRTPVNLPHRPSPRESGASTAYFPLVGLLSGLALFALVQLSRLDRHFDYSVVGSFLLVLGWVWFCDGLHLDGLADTLDGLASHQRGKKMLEIMHRGNTGAFGAAGILFSLLGKYLFLYSLPLDICWFLPLPLVVSRLFLSWGCTQRPYVGQKGSLSGSFILNTTAQDFTNALLWAGASFALLAVPAFLLSWAGWFKIVRALVACAAGFGLGWLALSRGRKSLGGISGDLLGFAQTFAELGTALALLLALDRQ
jgi:cobalamin synthase